MRSITHNYPQADGINVKVLSYHSKERKSFVSTVTREVRRGYVNTFRLMQDVETIDVKPVGRFSQKALEAFHATALALFPADAAAAFAAADGFPQWAGEQV